MKVENGNGYNSGIVVSGISGRFPKSNNMTELSHNLYNKIDMVDDDQTRCKNVLPGIPKRSGKINNLEKFDASFFSVHNRLANVTDPQSRILLEHSYEAILDAGISPQSIAGSKTGVFLGCYMGDSRELFLFQVQNGDGNNILGNANYNIANRISYALDLCGPSVTVDTACSSSGTALEYAFKSLRDGTCDAALVGGSQLVLNNASNKGFFDLNILASDGYCRPYDKNSSGFSRADTVCVLYLQKEKESKRVYANVLNVMCNNDGYKPEGSTFPSRVKQQELAEECYTKINLNPNLIGYIEAHSTATLVGDGEEVAGVDGAYCKNRSKPLLIGSVKSNMGHAEAASATASIAKVLLTLENQKIPPNINLIELRDDIPAFAEGRIKVVQEIEPLGSPYIAINSFGLGGANTHAIFKGNEKAKVNHGIPKDNLNRLLLWSGRTEAAVNAIFDEITARPLDAEHIALLQNSQTITTLSNIYRGFSIFAKGGASQKAVCTQRDIKHFNSNRKPVVWVYSGIGSQWLEMGRDLMSIPVYAKAIDSCHKVLLQKGLNLKDIITSKDVTTFDNVLHSYVGVIAIEIALTDLMKSMGMKPDYIIGHSFGELGCSYCDGCFTAEETILVAYARGMASNNSKNIAGAMAAIGINHKEVQSMLPADIDIACHNSGDSTTISGPAPTVKAFVRELILHKVFAKEVASSGVAFHSRYIKEMGVTLKKMLKKIIKTPKRRSEKWLSTTYPTDQWDLEESKFASAEYHTKNLLSPVLFQEALDQLPDCVSIEIAPHGLLKPLLKRALKESVHFSICQRGEEEGVKFLMNSLGQIFQSGIDFDIAKLYPRVDFPVSRTTPMISPLIKWDHSQDLYVTKFSSSKFYGHRDVFINISEKKFEYLQGHVIDGKVLLPATALITLVWETFGYLLEIPFLELPVIFEDIKFLRATTLQKHQDVILTIKIEHVSGNFVITEGQALIITGRIKISDEDHLSQIKAQPLENGYDFISKEFYKALRLRGYQYKDEFRNVTELSGDGLRGKIKWINNWAVFFDCMLQFEVLRSDSRKLVLPTRIRKVVINPLIHQKVLNQSPDEIIDYVYCPFTKILQAGGFEIQECEGTEINLLRKGVGPALLDIHKFFSHTKPTSQMTNLEMAKFCIEVLMDNLRTSTITTVEVDSHDGKDPLSEFIAQAIGNAITSDMTYITTRPTEIANVKVDTSTKLQDIKNVSIIVKSNCASDAQFLDNAKKSLNPGGFIISREDLRAQLPVRVALGFHVIATITTTTELIVLIEPTSTQYSRPEKVFKITSNVEEWFEPLKEAMQGGEVLIYSQNERASGILGLFNCLRMELQTDTTLTCVLIEDKSAPPFDIDLPFYKNQLQKGLTVNVYKNGQWGSYRHLRIKEDTEEKPSTDHCYLNCIKGDMSSLSWFEGKLRPESENVIRIKYSSLNFKDVIQAAGKITFKKRNRIEEQIFLGFEFSGVKSNGKRLMGITDGGSFSTYLEDEDCRLWEVPDDWSLEEAATVPLVYCTVLTAFQVAIKVQRGKSILIHAGSGGVGFAAIHMAFYYGLEVYTTVSTEDKKKFLLNEFPKLREQNIGSSRNLSFETMIKSNTNGRGVDYVLNSLSGDMLLASLRCLAKEGTFLEIGRYDIMEKTKIDMGFLEKNIKIEPIMIIVEALDRVGKVFQDLLDKRVIKPLKATVFEANEVQNAFRYLANGKHIGKVLIKIREHEEHLQSLPIHVKKQVFFDSSLSYIIVGGLGGFGLELADWMVLKGCKHLILSSSRGITSGYQKFRISNWKSYGVNVVVSTLDVTTEKGCKRLIEEATKLKPVGGIFNLAVALRDGLFENQTVQMFNESLGPKALATQHLDTVSRQLCPHLKHFVVFSSTACSRGNKGQTSYAFANSAMERIIEQRHESKLPAKAIQWGALGDVGLLAERQEKNRELTIGGTHLQSMSSCFSVIDVLLTDDEPIVASMIVAEQTAKEVKKDNLIDIMLVILGIEDKKRISLDTPLSKLGMDSIMTVEIMQVLDREFNLTLTVKELLTVSLNDLERKLNFKNAGTSDISSQQRNLDLLLRNVESEQKIDNSIVCLKKHPAKQSTKLLLIPGIEGIAGEVWKKLSGKFKLDTYALQINKFPGAKSLAEVHDRIIQDVINLYADCKSFVLVGYSFGALLTLQIAKALEARGLTGHIVMIDGSPMYFKRFSETSASVDSSIEVIQNDILKSLIRMDFPEKFEEIYKSILTGAVKEYLKSFVNFYKSNDTIEKKYSESLIQGLFNRMEMIHQLDEGAFSTLDSTQVSFIGATAKFVDDMPEDYNLQQYSSKTVRKLVVDGNHFTILQSEELTRFINDLN